MSLCFAAITPHPPLLLPSIAKDKMEYIKKTKEALEQLEQELYVSKPQLILVISPHGSLFQDAFSINAHTKFVATFEHFGDLTTSFTWPGSPDFAAKLGHAAKLTNVPLQLVSQDRIDHGTAVPLAYLLPHLPETKVVPIGYSGLNHEKHLAFGALLKETIMESDKRIAVIASADLSHLEKNHHPELPFDAALCRMLEEKRVEDIIAMDEKTIAEANQCGYYSLLILLGIIRDMQFTFRTLSYECPFGVGYLVGQVVL